MRWYNYNRIDSMQLNQLHYCLFTPSTIMFRWVGYVRDKSTTQWPHIQNDKQVATLGVPLEIQEILASFASTGALYCTRHIAHYSHPSITHFLHFHSAQRHNVKTPYNLTSCIRGANFRQIRSFFEHCSKSL